MVYLKINVIIGICELNSDFSAQMRLSNVFKITYEMNDESWLDHNRVVFITLAPQLKWF